MSTAKQVYCPPRIPDNAALQYQGLDIQAGDMTSMIYTDLDRIEDESEGQKIRESLLEYCKLDTLAMVMIWREFSNIAQTGQLSP